MSSAVDIAWAAGLYEGEGTCRGRIDTRPGYGRGQVTMALRMCDPEPVYRFAEVVGGKVYGPYAQSLAQKNPEKEYPPLWQWSVQSRREVARVFWMLRIHLSPRRREQFKLAVRKLRRHDGVHRV